jgi:alkyl hydroperoxide reductase subunit AhpC
MPSLLVCAAMLPSLTSSPAVELQYAGTLTAVGRGASKTPVKKFTLHGLVVPKRTGGSLTFVIDEQGGGGWAWPERFGRIALDGNHRPAGKTRIRLLHNHQGTKYPLVVRSPLFAFAAKLTDTAEWKDGNLHYEVVRRRNVGGHDCRQIDVAGRSGLTQTAWVAVNSPIVVKSRQTVFMGRGDRFLLEMELKSAKTVDKDRLPKLQSVLTPLLALQRTLNRKHLEVRPELSKTQLQAVSNTLKALDRQARSTPYHSLVTFIKSDAESQQRRVGDVSTLEKKFLGKAAPKLALTGLNGRTVDPKDYAGKVTVLHFWEYQGDTLEEPYGQVGYLDYLNTRRGKLGVKIYGVAVDSRLARKSTSAAALKSVRKLKSFMNLGYPVTVDDGALLKKFGDPRTVDAKLPLWVVIDAKGNVRHYKTGFYHIRPDEGLRPLDALLIKLIREGRK